MKFRIDDVLFMSAQKKDYNIDGKSGFYYYADVMIDGVVFRFKIRDNNVYELYKDTIEKRGSVEFALSPMGSQIRVYLVLFKED